MISVIIPAFNEEEQLGDCLESLRGQITSKPFEVIVVDNNSNDKTVQIARAFEGSLNIHIIHEPKQGRGQARQTGFRAATGELLLCTDADAVQPPNWIEKMVMVFNATSCVAVAGSGRLKDGSRVAQKLFGWLQPISARVYRIFFGHYWLPGFNFAIRREIYFAAGEFDATMDALEDNDLAWRVRKLGKICFIDSAPVAISGRRFERGFWRGMGEYIIVFVKYYFFKIRYIHWSNIR